jgi:hypothetical protein
VKTFMLVFLKSDSCVFGVRERGISRSILIIQGLLPYKSLVFILSKTFRTVLISSTPCKGFIGDCRIIRDQPQFFSVLSIFLSDYADN